MGDIGKTMSKILVFGGTGYLGQYVLKASILAGHQTYVYVRPTKSGDLVKLQLLEKFQAMGVTIFQVKYIILYWLVIWYSSAEQI